MLSGLGSRINGSHSESHSGSGRGGGVCFMCSSKKKS